VGAGDYHNRGGVLGNVRRGARFWLQSFPDQLEGGDVGFIGLLPQCAIIVPLGLVSGFLEWNLHADSFWEVASFWVENFTTVALIEELYFRAVLLNLIEQAMPSRRKWVGIVVSSIVFGLWHTPRRNAIGDQALYIAFSFVAGCVYSGVYIMGGNNVLGSSITHSITDTVWEYALRS